MWSPTHVQVLVKRAKGLKAKGKDGTNDAFVTIGLAKEKFRTSTKEKCGDPVEWMEQCELAIPSQGNTAEVALTVLHRNLIGVDEFLGHVALPLKDFDVYERPKTRWYELKCKPGQSKKGYRGELEVRIGFTVKASESLGGSTSDLSKKNKGSMSSLNKVAGTIGGSLMSLGNKEKKNIKKLVKSASHKVEKAGEKAKKSVSSLKLNKERGATLDPVPETAQWSTLDRRGLSDMRSGENLDPGVNSDEEGDDMFKFETLSQRSAASELSINRLDRLGRLSNSSTPFSGSLEAFNMETPPAFRPPQNNSKLRENTVDDWEAKIFGKKGDAPDTLSINSYQSNISQSNISQLNQTNNQLNQSANQTSNNLNSPSLGPASLTSQTTLEDGWRPNQQGPGSLHSLPSYTQATSSKPQHQKKKIIPVQEDLESSPSPPDSPSTSPIHSPTNCTSPANTLGAQQQSINRLGVSVSSLDLTASNVGGGSGSASLTNHGGGTGQLTQHGGGLGGGARKTLGLKLKNSYSFKEKSDDVTSNRGGQTLSGRNAGGHMDDLKSGRRNSVESNVSRHSRTHSEGSFGPPNDTRVVLGRETSPIPNTSSRLPQDLLNKYTGKSNAELVELVVNMERRLEDQSKKVHDLEDYIDSLLIRVMEVAPVLLQKDLNTSKSNISVIITGSSDTERSY